MAIVIQQPNFFREQRETDASIRWFTNLISNADKKKFKENSFDPRKDPFIGGMFFYRYDAKYKDILPYWDALPLTIPINLTKTHMLGLNLHYLTLAQRAILLNQLIKLKTKTTTPRYMQLSYNILQTVGQDRLWKKAIHEYIISRIQTRLVKVDHDDWKKAIALPVAQWRGGRPY